MLKIGESMAGLSEAVGGSSGERESAFDSARPTRLSCAAVSAGLSLLFLIVYGGCNWITSHRAHVGTWYYEVERNIPFIPLLIVPYMSIDLFFVGAPFVCQSRAELATLARRISFGIVMAGLCFLLIPLRIAVRAPETTGWTGAIFAFLHGFDRPYNLFPSLHITLWAILANVYARHTKGLVRVVGYAWFCLIALSTLLTYQHHVVDVIGGLILGAITFYLFRDPIIELEPIILEALSSARF